jgi:hypothetical protein
VSDGTAERGSIVTRSFAPLAPTQADLAPVNVEILDPQRQALEESHPATIEQNAHETRRPGQTIQHAPNL